VRFTRCFTKTSILPTTSLTIIHSNHPLGSTNLLAIGRPGQNRCTNATVFLKDLGLEKTESHRAQQIYQYQDLIPH
jgi:hypothetical protein